MVHSLNKGKNYERAIAKKLSKLFGISFQRVPMSGAFSTTKNTNSPIFKGDIFTEHEGFNNMFNVVIECKKLKKIGILDIVHYLNNEKGIIIEWRNQCVRESQPMNFWLIFSANNIGSFVIEGLNTTSFSGGYAFSTMKTLEQFLKEKEELWNDHSNDIQTK